MMRPLPPTVVVTDDAENLRQLLECDPRWHGANFLCSDGASEAFLLLDKLQVSPDLLVLTDFDLALGVRPDALDLAEEYRKQFPGLPILIFLGATERDNLRTQRLLRLENIEMMGTPS